MRKQDLKKYIIDFQIKHLNIGINTAEANAFTYLGLEKEQVDVEIAQRNESTIKAVKELISIYCLENKITENFFLKKRHQPLIQTKQVLIYYAANCLSLKEVGNIFKKHHTSIIHNRDVVENVVKNPIYDIDLYNEYIRVGNYIKMACNEAA